MGYPLSYARVSNLVFEIAIIANIHTSGVEKRKDYDP